MPTPRTAQLATMSDAELNARLCSRKVTDALLAPLATIPTSEARVEVMAERFTDDVLEQIARAKASAESESLDQLAADAAEAERIEGAGDDLAEHDSNGEA